MKEEKKKIPDVTLSPDEIEADLKNELERINHEFKKGFNFIKKYPKTVSFFGSARFRGENKYLKDTTELAKKIVTELGYGVITGSGPGIMEAANKGAKEANGNSLGLAIKLPREQFSNQYLTDVVGFNYFFTRKTLMTFGAEAYIFCPGGFGTLDEFFDILTLVQTKKIPQVPIILLGADFWQPLVEFIKKQFVEVNKTVNVEELDLFTVTDDHDKIVEIIKNSPVENWWKNYELD